MKSLFCSFTVALSVFLSQSAFASVACEFHLSINPADQKVELRIQDNESEQWTRINFPEGAYPLQPGMKVQFQSSFSKDDQATLEYDGQTLTYVNLQRGNFTKETVVMETSADLKEIRSVDYKRRLLYGFSLVKRPDTFTCVN